MRKLNGSVIIEVTRWCNLECEHCLRGNRQRKKQTYENLYNFLRNFSYVDVVTLTGGEPSLAPDVIGLFIDACRHLDLRVGSYYMATNAHKISTKFLKVWERLHHWCDDNDISNVDISNDKFHLSNNDQWKLLDYAELNGLPCHKKYNKKIFLPDYEDCISEGRAENWSKKTTEKTPFILRLSEDEISYADGELYLNCKGNVIHGCDWSFESQDKKENIIAHVSEFEPEMLLKLGTVEED
jgi:hypothetical protein